MRTPVYVLLTLCLVCGLTFYFSIYTNLPAQEAAETGAPGAAEEPKKPEATGPETAPTEAPASPAEKETPEETAKPPAGEVEAPLQEISFPAEAEVTADDVNLRLEKKLGASVGVIGKVYKGQKVKVLK